VGVWAFINVPESKITETRIIVFLIMVFNIKSRP